MPHSASIIDVKGTVSSDEHGDCDKDKSKNRSVYERLQDEYENDPAVHKELTIGKRVGFYKLKEEIGSGNFSQVRSGFHLLTKEKVAIKILDKTRLDKKTQRLLSREITSMQLLHHPNIIRLYEVIETMIKINMVMEFAEGGDLYHRITTKGRMAEVEAKLYFSQILSAVDHIHKKKIIHRDIKAENVFFYSSKLVKIGDFGFSIKYKENELLQTFCGSPPYAAPELFKDDNYQGEFVDIWALGILLYFIVTGIMPFRAETVSKLKKYIVEGSFNIPPFLSDNCVFLIKNILRQTPCDRFSIEQISKSHWLDGCEFPIEYDRNTTIISKNDKEMSPDDTNARTILSSIGIDNKMISDARERGLHSEIIGTYQIAFHTAQKQRHKELMVDRDPPTATSTKHTRQSRLCIIL